MHPSWLIFFYGLSEMANDAVVFLLFFLGCFYYCLYFSNVSQCLVSSIKFFVEPGRDSSPETKKDFIKYEFPRSTYTRVGEFGLNGLADNEVPQEIGEVAEMRIRVLGHNSENWIILSEVQSLASCLCNIFKSVNCLKYFIRTHKEMSSEGRTQHYPQG